MALGTAARHRYPNVREVFTGPRAAGKRMAVSPTAMPLSC